MTAKITGVQVLEGKKPTTVSATVTVPASSPVWGISMATTIDPLGTPGPLAASSPAQPAVVRTTPSLPIRYAVALLTGQEEALVSIAPCFDSDSARIKKQRLKEKEDSWVLESSQFAPCTTGMEVLAVADDILSRIHRVLALYCNFTPVLEVKCISWISAEGESFRTIRDSVAINVTSSKGLEDLRGIRGKQPLGSTVFEATESDSKVEEALTLHGDSGLNWWQIYDIIDFVGGVKVIANAGYASRKQAIAVRQTANHYRHQGLRKKPVLPVNPPTLAQANGFARALLKSWIESRL
jgi:hypothetical protein